MGNLYYIHEGITLDEHYEGLSMEAMGWIHKNMYAATVTIRHNHSHPHLPPGKIPIHHPTTALNDQPPHQTNFEYWDNSFLSKRITINDEKISFRGIGRLINADPTRHLSPSLDLLLNDLED